MRPWSLLYIILLFSASHLKAQEDFYAIDHIPEIRIYFEQSNWDAVLDSLYIVGNEARLGGDVSIDGSVYGKVGVRYKGYSSYSSNRDKNPFNIDLDYVVPGQNHLGFKKIKLSNVIQDPSFVREALSYDIARKYMPASKANFANVYVNDTLIGLYTNVEAVNSDFLYQHFDESANTFVKCNPETVSLNGENSNLSNSPGTSLESYHSLYDMKSSGDYDWHNFHELIDVLNNDQNALEEVLNVDRTLWMHALNYSLINFDSYVGYAQNYYLYQTTNGQFQPILWDMNMSFASYRLTDASDQWDGFNVIEAQSIDPLQHLNSFSVQPRPLIRNLLENDTYRRMYLAHIKTIIEENIESDTYYTDAQNMQAIIDADVQVDSNKFYTYQQFLDNLDSTVTDLVQYPGIKNLMEGREVYLLSYPGMNQSPEISNISENSSSGLSNEDLWITVEVQSPLAEQVYLYFRDTDQDKFQRIQMLDDGVNSDGQAGDGVYGAYFADPNFGMQYYIYAENDSIGAFSPARAAYEFYTVDLKPTSVDIVINEFMMSNSVNPDSYGEYDSWLEIHAAGSVPVSLDDFYLESASTGEVWTLPARKLKAGEYGLLWLDGDSTQGSDHCPFHPNIDDVLYLKYYDGTVIQGIFLEEYTRTTSSGKWPNATGAFRELIPTPAGQNLLAQETPVFEEALFIYPNPACSQISLRLNESAAEITIYSIDGKPIEALEMSTETLVINTTTWASGVYIAVAIGEHINESKRIVLNK